MKKAADIIISCRGLIIAVFLTITILFASFIPKAELEPDLKEMLPRNISSRINTERIDELFGGTEMLMVLLDTDDVLKPETLKRVKKIAKEMNKLKGVDKVLSLFDLKNIYSEYGAMIIDPAVKRIPRTAAETETLRENLKTNDLVYGSVVSRDFTLTAVIALLKTGVSDEYILEQISGLIKENPGPEEIIIGGMPNMRNQVNKYIKKDMLLLLPIGLLIMLVFLYLCFRELRGVILPALVVVMSIIFSMGLIPLLGWKIYIITILLPVILIAVANDYGIHLIAKYQEYNIPGNNDSAKELSGKIFQSLGKPVLLTGLTSMAGMFCLSGHTLVPAKQLGVLAAAGIAFALTASLLLIPALNSFLPKSKPVIGGNQGAGKKPVIERMLEYFGNLVSKNPKAIIIGAFIIAVVVSVGIFFIVIDTDPNKYFAEKTQVRRAAELINKNLGGTQTISIVYKGDIKDPGIMKKIDQMERMVGDYPDIGNTTSIARVIRQMSRALHDKGEQGYDRIPDNRNAVAQYFELYAMSGDAEDLEKLVDFPYEHALVTARINTSSTRIMNRVAESIDTVVKDDKDVLLVGGFGLILIEVADLLVKGQFISLSLAVLAVGLMLMILFRSVAAGLISAIPLALSIIILFGLMGVFGIELNTATALLSSIMIGVGIDYTIHFLWRYREERRNGFDAAAGVKKTLTTTGRGIVFNALSVVIGFIILLVSNFMPVKFFGFLVIVSILSCLGGALVLIPALCIVLKPKFLERR